MNNGEIMVTIDDDGNVSYEVKGVKGSGCEELTKELDAELGTVLENKKLPEFFQSQDQKLRHTR
jgi:hypothetical protein